MTDRPLRETKPFRLSHHEDFPGSIIVPDATVASFNSRVMRSGPASCWLYQPLPRVFRTNSGERIEPNPDRYFTISWTDEYGWGQGIPGHRLALLQDMGPIPSGLLACHHCATPACMNPRHLYAGTHKQNTADWMEMKALLKRTGGRKVIVVPMRRQIVCDAALSPIG